MRAVQRPLLFPVLIIALALVISSAGCKKEEPEVKDVKKETITTKNLQDARSSALKRASWYLKFAGQAKKVRQEGTASLFRAIARSEEIRAKVHADLLRSLNVEPEQVSVDSVEIGTSYQTLKMAVSLESSQVRSIYPNMIRSAESEKLPDVSAHFTQAQNVDLRHLELLKDAVDRHGQIPQKTYILCSECGHIMTSGKEAECPICHAKKERFEKL